ncbi:MAG: hypothetical protein K0B14_11770 [Anaerolineaceae bacterium]|nr:hypothetical protein [Anaerolineaceae bacterium]
MSDFIDPNPNQPNEEKSPSTGVFKRLLSRRHTTGVVLPQIRSRISRITKNSDLIRKNRLVLPGHTRREQYKSFRTKLLQKQTQAIKVGKKSTTNQVSGRWDQLDLSLSNGAPPDISRTNVFRPGSGDSGIPSGGQVITPFSPPAINNKPSFIERRQERLKNQETKKVKPTPTKIEKPSRLYSRVEEILPSSREKPVSLQQQVEKQIKSEDKQPSSDQASPQKQIPSEQKVENHTTQIKKSDVDQHPDSVGNDHVVRRQLANDSINAQKPEHTKSVPEQSAKDDVQKAESAKPSPPSMDDELKTFASKPSILKSKIDEKKNLEEKVIQQMVKKPSSKSSEQVKERKVEKQELTQSPKKAIKNAEETKDQTSRLIPAKETKPVPEEKKGQISRFIPAKETKPVSEEKEKIEEPSSLINKIDVISSSPGKIQREMEQESTPDLPVSAPGKDDEKDFHEERKLELPVVSKKNSNQTEEKNLTEKPIAREESAKFPVQQKQATQRSVTEKPELQARKSAKKVINLSNQKYSVYSSDPKVGKSKPKIFVPLIKKYDRKSETEKLVVSQKRPLATTPQNIIQRQPEDSSDALPGDDFSIHSRVNADEKDTPVFQKPITHNQPIQIDEQKIEGLKRVEQKSKPQPLKISQTPLSRKINRKFIEKKNVKTRTEGIQTIKKGAFPLVMRKLDQPKKQSNQEQSLEGSNGNQQIPDQIKVDNISVKQRTNKKSTNKNSIAEKLLVTQPGRIAIHNSMQKTKTGEVSPRNEPVLGKNKSTSRLQSIDQSLNSVRFVKQKKSPTIQKGSKLGKPIKRLPQSVSVPKILEAARKIEKSLPPSKAELPVVQMKKTTTIEPFIQHEVAVQGPVVHRMYSEPEMEESQLTGSQSEVKLDLSKLAREVYPIIKRWIAVEKERTSGRLY